MAQEPDKDNKPYIEVSNTGSQLETDIKTETIDFIPTEREEARPSESQEAFSAYMMDFAKRNYKKVISPDGRHIRINGMYHAVPIVPEEAEDVFSEKEKKMNSMSGKGGVEAREAMYDFLTFACSISREQLKLCDRGELKLIAVILGMMQNGFRDL